MVLGLYLIRLFDLWMEILDFGIWKILHLIANKANDEMEFERFDQENLLFFFFFSFLIGASKRPVMPPLDIWSLLMESLSIYHSSKLSSLKPTSPGRLVDWEKSTTTWWPSIVQLS